MDSEGSFAIENFKYPETFIDVDGVGVLYQEKTAAPTTWFVREVTESKVVAGYQ
jgi:hypothetical protein